MAVGSARSAGEKRSKHVIPFDLNSSPSLDICVNHTYVVLMTDTLETRLEITSWDEETVHEMADGSKITRM